MLLQMSIDYKLSELKPLTWKEIAYVLESDTSLFSFCVLVSVYLHLACLY